MSLEVLAGLTGRSKGWLSKVENGLARLERRQDIAAIAEALAVSADSLVGAPAPEIQPHADSYPIVALRAALLDATVEDPPDIPARPVPVLAELTAQLEQARRRADYDTLTRVLPGLLRELQTQAAASAGAERDLALRSLVQVCALATVVLKHLGQGDLAWVAADRGRHAAALLSDPVWQGAAAFECAHARFSANKAQALLATPRIADDLEPHIGDDRFAHEVYGMLRLSAALACAVQGDHDGAQAHAAKHPRSPHRWVTGPRRLASSAPPTSASGAPAWPSKRATPGKPSPTPTRSSRASLPPATAKRRCTWKRRGPARCWPTTATRCANSAPPSGSPRPRPATTR
jgi:transcriptional regulator with XRE-family HTH domain